VSPIELVSSVDQMQPHAATIARITPLLAGWRGSPGIRTATAALFFTEKKTGQRRESPARSQLV